MLQRPAAQGRAESRAVVTTQKYPSYKHEKHIPFFLFLPPYLLRVEEFSSFFSAKVMVTVAESTEMDNPMKLLFFFLRGH